MCFLSHYTLRSESLGSVARGLRMFWDTLIGEGTTRIGQSTAGLFGVFQRVSKDN
jgi:hypothetical protein